MNSRNIPQRHGDGPKPLNCSTHWLKEGNDSEGVPEKKGRMLR